MSEVVTPRLIAEAIEAAARSFPAIRWYGFGSFFMPGASYGDIDILAVCPEAAIAAQARMALAALCEDFPIHLVIMDEREAEATRFVQTEGALEISTFLG